MSCSRFARVTDEILATEQAEKVKRNKKNRYQPHLNSIAFKVTGILSSAKQKAQVETCAFYSKIACC